MHGDCEEPADLLTAEGSPAVCRDDGLSMILSMEKASRFAFFSSSILEVSVHVEIFGLARWCSRKSVVESESPLDR